MAPNIDNVGQKYRDIASYDMIMDLCPNIASDRYRHIHTTHTDTQYYCSHLPVSILLPMKKLLFWKKMLFSDNPVLCRLARCSDASIFALAAKYFIAPHEVVRSSVAFLKDLSLIHI